MYQFQIHYVTDLDGQGTTERDVTITTLRAEVIRNALLVGAGVGALATLIIGIRRQQHSEFHATQERITELRIKAVEQLGSTNPVVRIGGLHNLERLGEQHKELRQIILDEICAYLRLPAPNFSELSERFSNEDSTHLFEPMGPLPTPITDEIKQEFFVRMTANEILQRHVRWKGNQGNYWRHERLNLTGAYLADNDFTGAKLTNSNFHYATFEIGASFKDAIFETEPKFNFAHFKGPVDFTEATFMTNADFYHIKASHEVNFSKARGPARLYIYMMENVGNIVLEDADFSEVGLSNMKYKGAGSFKNLKVQQKFWIRNLSFDDGVNLEGIDVTRFKFDDDIRFKIEPSKIPANLRVGVDAQNTGWGRLVNPEGEL
ncbi:pentapeptide repeat-containing protein [Glycomyces luteolus]|uniref:Pentapeptide repeat-containing protein n=1 Tax=Glycomyces luteolus TaxID=2670330 RepID=A0A9X3PJL1_9ACTN|nr:pentapeptide repeat-containing protein [Glycomyces luteolus]MDA1359750.1 pentapeptide repeat-containing protein [Glycomyces luteolus]